MLALVWAPLAAAQSARIVLRWKDVPGAQGYELQIAKDAAFVEVVLQTRVPTPAYKWEQLPSVTHWWRVRSFDAEGRPSEWSQPRTVALDSTVPTPLSPADDALLPCAQPVQLSFEPSPLVKEFIVELSQSKDFAPARTITGKGPGIALGVVGPGTWFWRAKALDVRGRTGEASGVRRFSIRPGASKPKAVSDVVLGAPAVTLSWSDVACAASWIVEAANDTKEKVSLPSPGTSLAFKPNAAGEYRWRVAAVDERGVAGDWSAESVFKVRLGTPVPKGESSTPLKLDLAWAPVVGASGYRVEIAAAKDFKQIVSSGVVQGPSFRATDVAPGTVWWRVSAKDDKGHVSAFSEPRPVDVVAPEPLGAIVWLSPSSDVVLAPAEGLEVAWRPVEKALFYELELDGQVSQVLAATKVVTGLELGPHVLRVRAKGNGSRVSPWSDPRELFVGVPPVASAEVSVVGDEVRVVLKDAKGRRVEDVTPTFAVTRGSIEPPVPREGVFVSKWSAPGDGEDTLRITERAFSASVDLERPLPVAVSLALRAGGLFNFSSVASPTATVGLTVRLPVFQRRLGVELRAGVYAASRTVELTGSSLSASAWLVPVSLLLGWHQPLGAWSIRGGVGPAFQVAVVTVGDARETRVVGDLEAAVGVGRELGPGRLELELSGLLGRFDGTLARLNASGLGLKVGYSFDLGGR